MNRRFRHSILVLMSAIIGAALINLVLHRGFHAEAFLTKTITIGLFMGTLWLLAETMQARRSGVL